MLRIILPLLITVLFDNAYSQSFVWAKSLGGTKSEFPGSIATDPSGCVFTIGTFEGTADFDPGVGVSNLTAASRSDAFVSKLDPSGNFVWAKRIGGNNWDDGTSIAIDAAGNVYLGGHFNGTADFDPVPGPLIYLPMVITMFIYAN
ncbi:MAG: SBBP repeat-containing protein [Flammeovirgaceae bacterium]|nr:SBBP repeat-containing protein [Flammeovirgaceae bacterium]